MAAPKNPRGIPPIEHRWKPGQSGNPKGFSESPEVRMVRALTKQELADVANAIIKGGIAELQFMAWNPEIAGISALQAITASVMLKIYEKGDMQAFDALLNRMIGKVKDEVMHTGELNIPQVVVTLPSNKREAKKP